MRASSEGNVGIRNIAPYVVGSSGSIGFGKNSGNITNVNTHQIKYYYYAVLNIMTLDMNRIKNILD
jgi:hypothetical protein